MKWKKAHADTPSVVAVLPTPLPAVVAELDDVVLVAVLLSVHDETKKSLLLLLSIHHHPSPEEPVPTVLTGRKENVREHTTQETDHLSFHM